MERIDLMIDVTEAAGLGADAAIAATVHLPAPETLGATPIVAFAKPGGGFSRGYFTTALPGPGSGAQAEWHADRGFVFVSVDHLGTGDSSTHHDPAHLGFAAVTAASRAAEQVVLDRLADGTLHGSFPPVRHPVVLGIGQSMGGCLTVAQHGRYHCYDGIAVLGFSAVHTRLPVPPGEPPVVRPWVLRDTPAGQPRVIVNAPQVAAAPRVVRSAADAASVNDWLFHFDDVDVASLWRGSAAPPWVSTTYPVPVAAASTTPGVIAAEAAAVTVPVLVAMGERDVVPDPMGEARAYSSATSVDLYICPRMGHMHNFGGTRELLWRRIDTWAGWVGAATAASRPATSVRTDRRRSV